MARNLYLATGRQMPPLQFPDMARFMRAARSAIELIQSVAAAGRVGAAVRDRTTPRALDLKLAGLENAEVLKKPYRL